MEFNIFEFSFSYLTMSFWTSWDKLRYLRGYLSFLQNTFQLFWYIYIYNHLFYARIAQKHHVCRNSDLNVISHIITFVREVGSYDLFVIIRQTWHFSAAFVGQIRVIVVLRTLMNDAVQVRCIYFGVTRLVCAS